MELVDAASFFDRTPCNDGYTGDYLFDAQIGLYDDNRRDSETSERRTLSVAASAVIPDRRVVEAGGYRYIVGKGNPDTFFGDVIRVGFVAHEAPYLAKIRTLADVCLDSTGVSAWSGNAWLKNSAFTEQSSFLAPTFHMFFSVTEDVQDNHVVTIGTRHFIVRSWNHGAAGVLVALTEQVPEPDVESAMAVTGYDPVTGSETGATSTFNVLRLRWQSLFQYGQKAAPTFGPDDIQLALPKASYTPAPGTRFTLSDGSWRVASVTSQGTSWVCRMTKNG